MNDMNLLSKLRAEIPDEVSTGAEARFHEALLNEIAHPRESRSETRRTARLSRPKLSRPKLSLATGLAVAVAGAVVVAVPHSPSHGEATTSHPTPTVRLSTGDTLTVADLTARASAAALARKPVAPTQWLYIKLTQITTTSGGGDAHVTTTSDEEWRRADNQQLASPYDGQHRIYQGGLEYVSFAELSSLPADPRALVRYVYGKVPDGSASDRWTQTFEGLIGLFGYYNMPSATAAEVVQAFQYIPGVKAVTDPGDVAFSLTEYRNMTRKVLFDPKTYRVMGVSFILGAPADPVTQTTLQAPWIPVSGPYVQP